MANASANACLVVETFLPDDVTRLPAVRAAFAALYVAVFVLGMAGNLSMLASILRRQRSPALPWSVANVFLANLGVSDILLCLTAVPLTPLQILYKTWDFGWFMCRLTPATQGVSVLIASFSLCCIAIDRCWTIVKISRARMDLRRAVVILGIIWVFAIVANLPLFLTMRLVSIEVDNASLCGLFCEEEKWSPAVQKLYGTGILIVQFLLPMLIISFCYWTIFRKVRTDMVVGESELLRGDQLERAAGRRRRVTQILSAMVLAFLGSWAPLTLANILRDFALSPGRLWDEQVYLAHIGAHFCAMSSVVWNPLLYFWAAQSRRGAGLRAFLSGLTKPRRRLSETLDLCSVDAKSRLLLNATAPPSPPPAPPPETPANTVTWALEDRRHCIS